MELLFNKEDIEDNDHNNKWAYSISDLCSDWLGMYKEIERLNELLVTMDTKVDNKINQQSKENARLNNALSGVIEEVTCDGDDKASYWAAEEGKATRSEVIQILNKHFRRGEK